MSMSDPLGDMLTRIRNAQRSRHAACVSPASQLRANVLEALRREGYIRGFSSEELRPGISQLRIELKYNEGEPSSKRSRGSPSRAAACIPRSRNCPVTTPVSARRSCRRRAVCSAMRRPALRMSGGEVLCRVF